jgi:hypothetical protein
MRALPVLLSATLALSACVTGPDPTTADLLNDCALIAAVAREQYGYDHSTVLLLNSDGYAPICDWSRLGLKVEVVDPARIDALTPWLSFGRPWGVGGRQNIIVTHWMGVHFYERRCRLRLEGDRWRLAGECTLTWSF